MSAGHPVRHWIRRTDQLLRARNTAKAVGALRNTCDVTFHELEYAILRHAVGRETGAKRYHFPSDYALTAVLVHPLVPSLI